MTCLDWWRIPSVGFTIFRAVARNWLRCVGMAIPSEGMYSLDKIITTVERGCADPELVEVLMSLAENGKW